MEGFAGGPPVVFSAKPYLDLADEFTGECRKLCRVPGHPKKTCTNFRIPFAVQVVKKLRATRWLDPSAGWGDRLLAATLSPGIVQYVGIDPNPCVHEGYRRIIARTRHPDRYAVVQAPAERVLPRMEAASFDLVFTSPPFFDKEVYTDAPGQSIIGKADVKDWWTRFMRPVLFQSIRLLRPGGHMVLYVDGPDWVPRLHRYLDARLAYQGQLYYTDSVPAKHLRGAYVWLKE
jgi:SAM-dependent methyltransferase